MQKVPQVPLRDEAPPPPVSDLITVSCQVKDIRKDKHGVR